MPIQLDPSAQSFYGLIDSIYRQPAGEQPGRRSHMCLEGVQRVDRGFDMETLHWGTLAVPMSLHDTFQENVAKATIAGAKLFLHEERTPVFPLYFEMDMDLVTLAHEFRFVTEVILSGVPKDMTEDPRMEKYMKLPSLPPPMANDRVNSKLPKERNVQWWDLIHAIRDVCVEYNEVPILPAVVARFLCVFFHIALVRVIQKEVRTFYSELSDEESVGKLTTCILINHGPIVYERPDLNPKTGVSTYKMGAHYYMRGCTVTQTQALWIMENVLWELKKQFPGKPEEYWRKLIDTAGLMASSGGMRMPYSYKTKKCDVCTKNSGGLRAAGSASSATCLHCGGGGKIVVNRYYGPGAMLIGNGKFYPQDRVWHRFFRIPAFVLKMCTVRTSDSEPMRGFVSKNKKEPVLKHDPFRQLVSLIGEAAAERKRKRICEALQVDENDPKVMETLRIQNQFHAFDRGETPLVKHRVELIVGDPRRTALDNVLPELLGTLLHPCFDAPLDGACLVYEGDEESAPAYIVAFPKRQTTADGRCFNRLPERGSGPGVHSRKCTYFKFIREDPAGTGMPVVVQLCRNDNVKTSTRASQRPCCITHRSGGGAPKRLRQDKAWPGQAMKVPPNRSDPLGALSKIRDCFFLPKEQHHAKSMSLAEVEAARCTKRYAGGVPETPLCGPDLSYNYAVSKAVKEDPVKQKAHRKRFSVETTSVAAGARAEGDFTIGDAYLGY